MAGGRDYTKRQQGIISRYYDNMDTISRQKLGEIVSDLYLADSPKKVERLWKSAKTFLSKTDIHPTKIDQLVASRDVAALAKMVGELGI